MKRNAFILAGAGLLAVAGLGVQAQVADGRQRGQGDGGQRYSIAQATSDRAQLNTIAFDGLAFLTGDFNCDTFLPPGKISDFFGFQYLRDIDGAALGHNTDFLTRIADNTLRILNDEQKARLVALGKAQVPRIRELALQRFPLIAAFCRNLAGDRPAGSAGLSRAAVTNYVADIFELSGRLAYERAEVYGAIQQSLTAAQQDAFARLKFGDSRTWPDGAEGFDRRTVSHPVHVAMMTYASEYFSWRAGSVEADTYFCPEGHGTYFGSFYMKDAPAVHRKNYSISTALTGDSGAAFLKVLTPAQRAQVEQLVELQRNDLRDIVNTRRAVAVELRKFAAGGKADPDRIRALGRHYGALDGEIAYWYATHFAEVNRTLTTEQRAALKKLRGIEGYSAASPFVYADPVVPAQWNSDFLFLTAPGTARLKTNL